MFFVVSRSFRKTPIFGHTTARSEAGDKRLWHKRWRTQERDLLTTLPPDREHHPTLRNAVSNTWGMAKDGKSWFSPTKQQKIAEQIAARTTSSALQQKKLLKRILAKWRAK
jgi:hypothetical protein